MKKIVTFIMTTIMAVVMLFSFTACTPAGSGVVDVTTKTITVGYTDYAPMNYEENGVLKGFDTELALMTFNALGYDVRFKLIEWSNKYSELESGTIDCVWNGFTMNSTDEINGVKTDRTEIVDFTKPYMFNAQCIVRRNNVAEITDIAQFAGKAVAYEAGSAAVDFVDTLTGINNVALESQMKALQEVNAGTADYAVVDIILAKANAGKGNYANLVINEGLEMDQELYAIAFAKDSTLDEKVNIMLQAFADTGVLTDLATKYGLENVVILDGYVA
ncbi:MAG: transporter substrate-binding domain-containing protein [Clostridia bacterium]|nr:transporter substrate-binding domain-containing protein [Clostridia bacterium]